MGKKARRDAISKAAELRYAWWVELAGVDETFLVIAPDAERAARGARKAARERLGVPQFESADIESLKRLGEIDAEVA